MGVFAPVEKLSEDEDAPPAPTGQAATPAPKPKGKPKASPKNKAKAKAKAKPSPEAKPKPLPKEKAKTLPKKKTANKKDPDTADAAAAQAKKPTEVVSGEGNEDDKQPEEPEPAVFRKPALKRPAASPASTGNAETEGGGKRRMPRPDSWLHGGGLDRKISKLYFYKRSGKYACACDGHEAFQVGALDVKNWDRLKEIAEICRNYLVIGKTVAYVRDVADTLFEDFIESERSGASSSAVRVPMPNGPPMPGADGAVEVPETLESRPGAPSGPACELMSDPMGDPEGGEEEAPEEDPVEPPKPAPEDVE